MEKFIIPVNRQFFKLNNKIYKLKQVTKKIKV